ncbi:hypothetical protein HZB02_03135 [Candidatus Woesearchaeota archaeon]|nr:hypothetical protein [Candidatus Woesearchaeota archaeon]
MKLETRARKLFLGLGLSALLCGSVARAEQLNRSNEEAEYKDNFPHISQVLDDHYLSWNLTDELTTDVLTLHTKTIPLIPAFGFSWFGPLRHPSQERDKRYTLHLHREEEEDLIDRLLFFAETLGNHGISIEAIGPEYLASLYTLPMKNDHSVFGFLHTTKLKRECREACSASLSVVQHYLIGIEGIQHGLGNWAADNIGIILRSASSLEDISTRANVVTAYLTQLHLRGEQELVYALNSLNDSEAIPTMGLVEKLLALHQNYGILELARLQHNPEDMTLIDELLRNTSKEYHAERPLAVLVMARSDPNGAFSEGSFQDRLEDIFEHYKVLIYSIAAKSGIYTSLATATTSNAKPVSLLYIAGHGDQGFVLFDRGPYEGIEPAIGHGIIDYGNKPADKQLSINDRSLMESWQQFFSSDARIILESCSTGSCPEEPNMANELAFALPGHCVSAPLDDFSGIIVRLGNHATIREVRFTETLVNDQKMTSGVFAGSSPKISQADVGTYTVITYR